MNAWGEKEKKRNPEKFTKTRAFLYICTSNIQKNYFSNRFSDYKYLINKCINENIFLFRKRKNL